MARREPCDRHGVCHGITGHALFEGCCLATASKRSDDFASASEPRLTASVTAIWRGAQRHRGLTA